MTAVRPLMTPSILSPATRADYPQRHLLTLYANDTERGSNEKRVTDKKDGEKRNRRKGIGNGVGRKKICEGKRDKTKCLNVCDREENKKEQKTKRGHICEHTQCERDEIQ